METLFSRLSSRRIFSRRFDHQTRRFDCHNRRNTSGCRSSQLFLNHEIVLNDNHRRVGGLFEYRTRASILSTLCGAIKRGRGDSQVREHARAPTSVCEIQWKLKFVTIGRTLYLGEPSAPLYPAPVRVRGFRIQPFPTSEPTFSGSTVARRSQNSEFFETTTQTSNISQKEHCACLLERTRHVMHALESMDRRERGFH